MRRGEIKRELEKKRETDMKRGKNKGKVGKRTTKRRKETKREKERHEKESDILPTLNNNLVPVLHATHLNRLFLCTGRSFCVKLQTRLCSNSNYQVTADRPFQRNSVSIRVTQRASTTYHLMLNTTKVFGNLTTIICRFNNNYYELT